MTMKATSLAVALIAAAGLCAAAPAAAAAPKAKAKGADWVRMVVPTVDGGFRMGNPAAPVKLVEYGSLTCPHCGHFAREATPSLHNYIRSGKLSYEYRNFVLNGVDVAATLLARCGGAKSFFPIADALYASQSVWVGAVTSLSDARKAELSALPQTPRLQKVAEIAGLYPVAAKNGIPVAKARQCLADEAGFDEIGRIHDQAVALGVQGTPSFFLNGRQLEGFTWDTVGPDLRSAIAGG